jgi:hypothetical protein
MHNCKFHKIEFRERESTALRSFFANQKSVKEIDFCLDFDEVIDNN